MSLPLYRGKVLFVTLVGLVVTVTLVATAGFYFLQNRASEQALKRQAETAQNELPTTFNVPLSGSGVFNSDMIDVAKEEPVQGASGDRSDSQSGSQGQSYVLPESTDWNEVSPDTVTTTTTVNNGTDSDGVGAVDPDRNTVYRLRTQGDKIYYPSGKEAMLRGFTWGTWGTTRFHDADRNTVEGANTVRIVLRWWGKYYDDSVDSRDDNAPGNIDPEHLAELDRMIEQASEKGLWIDLAIDSDCGQNGLQQDSPGTKEYCDPTGKYGSAGHNFWTDTEARAKFIETWKFVADRYKKTPYIGMFELLPEPNPVTFPAAKISEFYQQLIAAVHPMDPRTPFLLGSRVYMIKLVESSYIDVEDGVSVIYTGNLFAHPEIGEYGDVMYDLEYRLKHLTDFREKYRVPVFVQQTGVRSEDDPGEIYADAVLALLNKNSVGWDWWEYRQQGSFAGGYGVWYVKADGTWVKKDAVSKVISKYFKE